MKKIFKDKNTRKILLDNSKNSLLLKVLFNNRILPLKFRTQFVIQSRLNQSFPAHNRLGHLKFSSQIHNFCLLTGRSRGILPSFKVSRIVFKSNADLGLIPGIKRASW